MSTVEQKIDPKIAWDIHFKNKQWLPALDSDIPLPTIKQYHAFAMLRNFCPDTFWLEFAWKDMCTQIDERRKSKEDRNNQKKRSSFGETIMSKLRSYLPVRA